MKIRHAGVWAVVSLTLAACGSSSSDEAPINASTGGSMSMEVEASAQRGKPLYDRYCGFCHGSVGEGYLADNANALANQDFLAVATDEFIQIAIIEGRPGTPMSPWGEKNGGPLSITDARDITAYIRQWQTAPTKTLPNGSTTGSAVAGKVTYGALCKDCHGVEGEGITAISLNNPWFLETASDGLIRDAIVSGREGTPMPAYVELLSPQEIENLVALIRSWARPVNEAVMPAFEPDIGRAVLNPDGPVATFELRDERFVPATQVKEAMDAGESFVLVDARPVADYLDSHIKGAVSIPFYRIGEYLDELPTDRFIITYCGCPHAVSGQAADALIEAGFTQVAVLDEGYYFWAEQEGWPLTKGPPMERVAP